MTDRELPWARADWFEQASAWIQVELARHAIELIGAIEQPHIRPWSTVLRVPTNQGDLYFKATAPVLAHEPALTQALSVWRPDCMLQLLATDLDRGWLLMRDAGATLRSQIQSVADLHLWQPILTTYADVQIEMISRADELLALGTLDRRLATLPAQYEQLLADTDALLIDQQDGLTADEYRRLRELVPEFAAMCERLAGYQIPETLHHDDFHDANIFVSDGRFVFSDWGESCVAHPFFTLLVTLRGVAYRLQLDDHAPELAQLRDVYLAPFQRFGSPERLREAFALANRVAMVCRVLTWYRVVSSLDAALKAEYADAVPGWLQEFLNAGGSAA
ncbi:MAG: phosphotransferase [Chloroflexi bacterium]|nr:phosphotransferase [Chloroflexota bacterium]